MAPTLTFADVLTLTGEAQLTAIRDYLVRIDASTAQLRAARVETIKALRAEQPPVTWRRLAEATGLSEQYLREAAR
jgi:hypothetical protein